ncbi:Methyltransferase type 11 [Moelleriella libera RCEF 2490]|uniref:Methyltransferase type 11 n=1 Tax=Moelleriella libera RCEF 2490 TaxID=1081109 RepID=A0A162INJ6_9HYPO|nr:Methyltransferase type 11 [Moelleriella libera RCEF 2490]
MADTITCSLGTNQAHQSSQVRRPKRLLNPIIEEDSDGGQKRNSASDQRHLQANLLHLGVKAWLSPMSDHFPTPRGLHYLSAPVLPSSPSTVSPDGSSPTTSSEPWNRASIATENTVFEDLYDVSDEEAEDVGSCRRPSTSRKPSQGRCVKQLLSKQPTRLEIPSSAEDLNEAWAAVNEVNKFISPVPATPSVQVAMSPAQMDFMGHRQLLEVPTVSAPPSLDGSLSSEQLAAMSAPPTPVDEEQATEERWAGIHLQPDALATLQTLHGDEAEEDAQGRPVQVIDVSLSPAIPATTEMRELPPRALSNLTAQLFQGPTSVHIQNRQSLAGLTRLDIPSPTGFFSGLSPRSRNTWHPPTQTPIELPPPTSTTAEQFYRCPWNIASSVPPVPKRPDSAEIFYRAFGPGTLSEPMEQVVEITPDDDMTDGLPTARPLLPHQNSNDSGITMKIPASPNHEDAPTEIITEIDPGYARKQREEALSHLGRTEIWLMAQRAYLGAIDGGEQSIIRKAVEGTSDGGQDNGITRTESLDESAPMIQKHGVRFSNTVNHMIGPKSLPSKLSRQESAYYRAFQGYVVRTQLRDVFVQQLCRFEALQAQRTALRETHRNQLLGKFQLSVVPQSAKKRMSANVVRGDFVLTDDLEKLRKEKESEAMDQMAISVWRVAAFKFLNGGRLVSSPVTRRLARLSSATSGPNGTSRDRARILDLGGQAVCDWAWHCALQYPNAKVYTVTTKAIRQLSNANIRGPPNHRQVSVRRLTKLPFADNQFDLVSARELHSVLKLIGENGEDEWESCLGECMRVLKPGGYLEFSVMDSDIMNAGPIGLAKSVEFGFALKTLGYDPSPSKLWLSRLARAGFGDVRRAWVCLPLGAKRRLNFPVVEENTSIGCATSFQRDAKVMGSSDNIASVCSLVGGWSWERWLLRCEMERVAGEMRLVDTVTTGGAMREAGKCLNGVHAVMEESRGCKAGIRMLNGYARKPLQCSQVIHIALAQ